MPPKKRKLRVVQEEPAPSAKATVVPLPAVKQNAANIRVCPRGCTEILDEHMECPVCESTLINPIKQTGD